MSLRLVALLFMATTVHADGSDDVDRCARLAGADARIACLEAALERRGDATDDASTANSHPRGERGLSDAAHAGGDAVEAGSDARPVRDEPAARPGVDDARPPRDRPSVEVVIVSIDENAYGKVVYTMDDGQIWLQTDQRTPRYDELPLQAEIRGAAAGSYFIRPLSGGIAVRVKRWK